LVALVGCGTDGNTGETSSSGGTISANGGTAATSGGTVATNGGTSYGGATPSSGGASSSGGGTANHGGTLGSGGTMVGSGGGKTGTSSGGTVSTAGGAATSGGASNNGGSGGGSAGSDSTQIDVPAGYKLVWHDEFDQDGAPNPANWKFEKGFVRNEEAQWYQPDNASVSGGYLVIEGRRERVSNPNYQSGSSDWKTSRQYAEYTSSSLNTSGLQSWQYGRFEMRARFAAKNGLWPAWWTLGVSGEWPSNGEIDIMEYYQNKVLANVACGTSTRWSAKWDSATKTIASFNDPDWDSKFHTWRMDWDDQKIVLYLDDAQMNTSNLADMLNSDGKSPFKQKAYMLVNLAIGGQNGGDPANTQFPTRYEIDYLRVFQKQ
jgi:beta-glucanase (GH16 family)